MKKRIKRAWVILRGNWSTIVGFEILYKLLGFAVGLPLFAGMTFVTMQISGYKYITYENMKYFLKNPATVTGFLLLVFLLTVYTIFDISALVFAAANSYDNIQVTIWQTTRFAWRTIKRVFQKGNRRIIGVLLVLLILLNVGSFATFAGTVTVPSFIRSAIRTHREVIAAGLAAAMIPAFLWLKKLYLFHYFALENCSYREAKERSVRLSKGRKGADLLVLAGEQTLFYAGYFIMAAIGIVLVLAVAKLFSQLRILNYVYTSAVWGLLMVVLAIVAALGTPISFGCISVLYYMHKEDAKEPVQHENLNIQRVQDKTRKRVRRIQWALLAGAFLTCTILIYRSATERLNPQIEYLRTIEVTAHRGASAFYPENTMAAFEGAVEFGADWIELDVQQSRDGQLFIMHDHNFYRTTGVMGYSWETDYKEISQLDAGSSFNETFQGEKVPLLSDVIDFAKENEVKLNIELKPTGNDVDMEKRVVDLIREKEFTDCCVITSQVYSALEKVKEYDPEIKTVYVMSLAYGNVNKLTAADGFSMEAGSVTPGMVSRIHNAGKQIFVWTVNSRKTMNRMIDMNVDNIITDRVSLVQQCIYENKTNNVIRKYVRFLRGR